MGNFKQVSSLKPSAGSCREHDIEPDIFIDDPAGALIRCPKGCYQAHAETYEAAAALWRRRNTSRRPLVLAMGLAVLAAAAFVLAKPWL